MKPFFWPLACGAPSPHQSNALKGVGRRELVTFSEFFACNLHASCIQLTELQRWNSENKISCMRLMLSGFHHWSPVSCMQVACNAMQFSRVSLFYTFSKYFLLSREEILRKIMDSSVIQKFVYRFKYHIADIQDWPTNNDQLTINDISGILQRTHYLQ